jgi:hypothetical protein
VAVQLKLLAGTLVIFLAIILVPADDLVFFRLLFSLVRFFHDWKARLRRFLGLILGLLSHEQLLTGGFTITPCSGDES